MLPLIPSVGGAVVSAGASAVRSTIDHLVNSVVGIFDPGKARDAQRESRAEMWYQIAVQGSTYAGRHVFGGRTLVYTVKEKGYYEDRWNKLMSNNPRIATLSQQMGGLGIPDNPTDAEKNQMAQEIDAYNNQNFLTAGLSDQGKALVAAAQATPTATFTPQPILPGQAPVAQPSPAWNGQAQPLPTMVTTAQMTQPVTHTWLYVLAGLLGIGVLIFAARKFGK